MPAKRTVIEFQGRQLPVDQLQTQKSDTCDADHYRALKDGSAVAVDGSVVVEPSGCGFGKVNETPTFEVEVR